MAKALLFSGSQRRARVDGIVNEALESPTQHDRKTALYRAANYHQEIASNAFNFARPIETMVAATAFVGIAAEVLGRRGVAKACAATAGLLLSVELGASAVEGQNSAAVNDLLHAAEGMQNSQMNAVQ